MFMMGVMHEIRLKMDCFLYSWSRILIFMKIVLSFSL